MGERMDNLTFWKHRHHLKFGNSSKLNTHFAKNSTIIICGICFRDCVLGSNYGMLQIVTIILLLSLETLFVMIYGLLWFALKQACW
jgi:hypothetical protein